MVQIKRVYDPASPEDGKRILIDRLWPRGMKKDEAKIDEWIKEIAPSTDLRKWFAHDPERWREFKRRYQQELKTKSDVIELLRKEARKGTVTLLFSAHDLEHNNAVVLREVIGPRARRERAERRPTVGL